MPSTEKSFGRPSKSVGLLPIVAKCIRVLWVATFSLWVGGWAYLGRYRPTKPQAASGMIYPLSFRGWTIYVRHFEYALAGPLTWCVFGLFVLFVTIGALATRSDRSSEYGEHHQ
jgi:hypothetical protein